VAIRFKCPNGHRLHVKEKYGGRTGYCPQCKTKVRVPVSEEMAEVTVMSMMNEPPTESATTSESVLDQPEPTGGESGASLLGSSFVRQRKVCPNCGHLASFSFSACPTCGTRLPKTAFEKAKQKGEEKRD